MQNANDPTFEQFWAMYPRRDGKKDAMKAWARLEVAQKCAALAAIPMHIRYWQAEGRERHYTPMPSTWIRGERWDDEIEMPKPKEAQWWASQEGIKAKAIELGMWPPRGGEGWHELKARVQARIDTTARAA